MIDVAHLISATATVTASCISGGGDICDTGLTNVGANSSSLKIALQIVFGVVAAISVLMVTIGGFRYITSEGNPENTKRGRDTILFALIGLAIALSAEALVSFFVNGI